MYKEGTGKALGKCWESTGKNLECNEKVLGKYMESTEIVKIKQEKYQECTCKVMESFFLKFFLLILLRREISRHMYNMS